MEKSAEKDKAERMIVRFAHSHPCIDAVYRGCDPEEGSPAYYFLTQGPYDRGFEDRVSSLDIHIARGTGHNCSLLVWPLNPEQANETGFMKECIYRKSA